MELTAWLLSPFADACKSNTNFSIQEELVAVKTNWNLSFSVKNHTRNFDYMGISKSHPNLG